MPAFDPFPPRIPRGALLALGALGLALGLAVVGCRGEPPDELGVAASTGGRARAVAGPSRSAELDDEAAERGGGPTDPRLVVLLDVAAARCRYFRVCDGIGPGRAFPNMSACMRTVRGRLARDVAVTACARVDPGALATCRRAVETRVCDPFVPIGESYPAECTTTRLCEAVRR